MSIFKRLRNKQTEKALASLPPKPDVAVATTTEAAIPVTPTDDDAAIAAEMEYLRQQEARVARLRARNAARILRAQE